MRKVDLNAEKNDVCHKIWMLPPKLWAKGGFVNVEKISHFDTKIIINLDLNVN